MLDLEVCARQGFIQSGEEGEKASHLLLCQWLKELPGPDSGLHGKGKRQRSINSPIKCKFQTLVGS